MNNNNLHPAKAFSQQDIKQRWKHDTLCLTVVCRTYNHAAYIEQALSGILSQVTEFPFEILCCDDASDDGTADIIREYASRYPEIIRTILLEENQQKSKGIKVFPVYIQPQIRGEYTCTCEGDDFWSDQNKIQKQIIFLKANPSYVGCTHAVVSIDEQNKVLNRNHLPERYRKGFSSLELKRAWAEPLTQSLIYRNVLIYPPEFHKSYLGDVFRGSMLGEIGEIAYLSDISPSAYRFHNGGAFSPLDLSNKIDVQILTFFWIQKYYKRKGETETANFFKRRYLEKALRDISLKDIAKLLLIRFFKVNPKKWL